MADDRKRVLVLGSSGHGRTVKAHTWATLPGALNVADFDVVILNFAAFLDDEIRNSVALSNLPKIEQFMRLLFSEGSMVIAIGHPRVEFGDGGFSFSHATWWLPVDLPTKTESGEVITNVKPDWQFWLDHVDRYAWHFWNAPIPPTASDWKIQAARAGFPRAQIFGARWASLAETRTGVPIAIELELAAAWEGFARSRRDTTKITETKDASGRIFWLPAPTDITLAEGIDLLLREVVGIATEEVRPEWLHRYRLSRQEAASQTVEERRDDLESAHQKLIAAQQEEEREARWACLLYESGTEVLEPVVRDALTALQAKVTEPDRRGIEDGRLEDPSRRRAMLEIKGRTGQLKLEDVRQLDGWMRTALANEAWQGKGLVIANLKLREPPDSRTDLVAPNALSFAETIGVAILTTPQLYEALRRDQEGTFDATAFWDAIIDAKGLVDLPDAQGLH